jgi:hypothetical protein
MTILTNLLLALALQTPLPMHGGEKPMPKLPNSDTVPRLTVCEALSHPEEYDGKIVQISDRVTGTSEWTAFTSSDCPQILVTDGKIWQSAIVWQMPRNMDLIIHPVEFTFDLESQKKVNNKLERLRRTVSSSCAVFTYTGLFEVWSKAKARKPVPGGWQEYSGFGHLSGGGARLILKSADDVAILPACKTE